MHNMRSMKRWTNICRGVEEVKREIGREKREREREKKSERETGRVK